MIRVERARELVAHFAEQRILVVGDLMLDRYLWGSVERISPEAPVPVVKVHRESTMLGGAGNVVRNLVSLGAQVDVIAYVGTDEAADELHRRLDHWKIDPSGLVHVAGRPTTQKTRIIASGQQVVRFDRESDDPIEDGSAEELLAQVRSRVRLGHGVILEDYGKGLLVPDTVRACMRICAEAGTPVFVDPKLLPWDVYAGAALVKPNLREAQELAKRRVRSASDLEELGREVLEHTGAELVAITRGDEGMTLFPREGPSEHVPTVPRAVADQAGAGDTAIATLALARLAGATWREAAALANAAAGVVVGIPGTATLSPADLLTAVEVAH